MELADIQLGHWTLVFSQVTGRVLDSSKWSETHVSGGGGGTPPSYGGNHPEAKSVDIRSTVTTEHEVWIKDEDTGKEQDIRLSGVDVPLRAGQRITLISLRGWRNGREKNRLDNVRLVNHDAGGYWQLQSTDKVRDLAGYATLRRFLYGFVIVVVSLVGGCSVLVGDAEPGSRVTVLLVAGVVVALAVRRMRGIPKDEPLATHLTELVRAAFRAGEASANPNGHEGEQGRA